MGSQTLNLSPQFLQKRINTNLSTTLFSFQPNFKLLKPTSLSSSNNQQLVSTATSQVYDVEFKTLGACKLGISRYPDFEYDAAGGAGSGTATQATATDSDGRVSVEFDVKHLYIPPLSSATTKFLGLPLPPFIKINIVPEAFRGEINQKSGKVDLKFTAKFCFSVGSLYRARPLLVETVLTSEESKGTMRGGRGERLDEDGKCRLVGVATVEPINDVFMDTFLSLPTECLAVLNAVISFSTNQLLVETVLTSEESKGTMRGGRGERLDEDGKCRLVGVATVEPINDVFMDTFLSLPTECLAVLNAVISFSTNQ